MMGCAMQSDELVWSSIKLEKASDQKRDIATDGTACR